MREKLEADFRFVILNPTGGRTTFKIDRRPGKRVSDPRLDAINQKFKLGELTFEAAKKQVEELRYNLYREEKAIKAVVHNSDNQRLRDRYWEAEYSHRELVDPKTAGYELDRAVSALGSLSIHSASKEEIQKAVDQFKGDAQRRIISALKRLLIFAGRTDVKLRKAKPENRRVRTLSEAEFKSVLKHIKLDAIETLMTVAFYTGARIGEIWAMEPQDFNPKSLELKIFQQIDKDGAYRDTKNRHDRTTLVFPKGVKALQEWFLVKSSLDPSIRPHMAEIVKDACKKEFPTNSQKHLVFHDLRHCYARLVRETGLSTEDVADMIGDSLVVAKKHYTNFGPTDAIMDIRRRAIKHKKAA